MARDTYLRKILGDKCFEDLKLTKVLMVGAGGIGCELLKNLILGGYGEIHIVDLDTITLSNLNRQFLFRQKDIDKSKSMTVAKAVESFNYLNAKLVPYHGNIMDKEQFPLEWWDQFSYIFNALDNLEARKYVNKMSLFLSKPLMESGTTGYEGQVQPIYPYVTECFECQAKATPKTFPVCTIRSTPSQPVHCITWAKEFLFSQLFDESTTSVNQAQLEKETDDKKEVENMLRESNELSDLRELIKTASIDEFYYEMVSKIFKIDTERLLLIDSLWKTRRRPEPLDVDKYKEELTSLIKSDSESVSASETKCWTIAENLYVLHSACESLQSRLTNGEESFISFDKDDENTLDFVVAASNLRSAVFGIDLMSKFDIKQIAGNIIPAIATTNAIIAGFSSINSLSFFKRQKESPDITDVASKSSSVFISIRPNKYITSALVESPNPKCASCSFCSRGVLSITKQQIEELTLQELVDKLCSEYLYDDISLILGPSSLIYDADFDDNASKKLSELSGFTSGQTLLVQDEDDQLENLELYIQIVDSSTQMLPDLSLRSKKSLSEPAPEAVEKPEESHGAAEILFIDDEEDLVDLSEPVTKKRRTK